MTGAPIYLVSACTSGEEFVAAFRRYADKSGVFVPIREPLPVGARARFAVTLRDGGVMLDGEAEIISASRTPSVLHGRIGMTLRFVAPDAPSKTLLNELAMARLSMRPAPPSVAPRPADVPAEPRPEPPAPAGRIDAVNALAECIAIGPIDALLAGVTVVGTDTEAPSKPAPRPRTPTGGASIIPPSASAATGPKTSPKLGLPSVPAVPPVPSVPSGARPKTPTAQPMPPIASAIPPIASAIPSIATPRTMTPTTGMRPLTASGANGSNGSSHAASARPPTSPRPIVAPPIAPAPPPSEPEAPIVTPRATPQPAELQKSVDQLARQDISGFSTTMAAVSPPAPPTTTLGAKVPASPTPTAPIAPPGPSSDTYVAAVPPAPEPRKREGIQSATMTAIPLSAAALQSAPTDIGGVIVDPSSETDPEGAPVADGAVVIAATTRDRDDASTRTQVHAGAPRPEPTRPTGSRDAIPVPASRDAIPTSPLPGPLTPAPPIVAASRAVPEIEIAEPTDLSWGPPEQTQRSARIPVAPPVVVEIEESTSPDAQVSRPRKTALGVAVQATDPADAPTESRLALDPPPDPPPDPSEEPTGAMPVIIDESGEPTGVGEVDDRTPAELPAAAPPPSNDWKAGVAPAATPAAARAPVPTPAPMPVSMPVAPRAAKPTPAPRAAKPTPVPREPSGPASTAGLSPGDWIMPQAKLAGLVVAGQEHAAPPAAQRAKLPTGDWTIALDPQAPDGWSEPAPAAEGAHRSSSPQIDPSAQAAAIDPAKPKAKKPKPKPVAPIAPAKPAKAPEPVEARDDLPSEPKVQIDPTLIQPLRPMPTDGPLAGPVHDDPFRHAPASSTDIPQYAESGPAMSAPMAAFAQPVHGQAPAYPMDPAYQVVPSNPLARHMPTSEVTSVARPNPGRRRIIIVLLTAILAVIVGVLALAVLNKRGGSGSGEAPKPAKTSDATAPTTRAPAPALAAAAIAPLGHTTTPSSAAPATPSAAPTTQVAAHAAMPSAAPAPCYADITSAPAGAEVVVGAEVVGTTPHKLTAPCDAPVEVTVRKARLVAVTRTVKPSADGATLKVALARQTFQVKVSSQPAGATVALDGKQLGVTPTTIKLPAFEAATLSLSKEGYLASSERLTPRANGVAVHSVLKRRGR